MMDKERAEHHIKQLEKMRKDHYCAEVHPGSVDAEGIFLTIGEIDALIEYCRKIVDGNSINT